MKHHLKFLRHTAHAIAAALLLQSAIGNPQSAMGQVTATYYSNCLTAPMTFQTAASNLVAGSYITNRLWQGHHLGIGMQFIGGSSTNTGAIGFQFGVLFKGPNGTITTTKPFTITSAANGTALVNDWAVLPNYTVGPADAILLLGITNAPANVNPVPSGSVTVSNVWIQTDTRP